ncbi:AtpZ/AtpI family protein [Acetobacteraceae bacterium KSS8]|uniref:ATP synthase protein I n=1 Tax=Endosaccharibacter trunci TaxID=2812733 RepID=A0ABT1W6P3_9PROT|nr:AtpZ/AtpI family protein [Acetobacteraceae bacterium KSS8]
MDEDKTGTGTTETNSFDSRLAEARAKRGLDRPADQPNAVPTDMSAFTVFFRVGIELVSAVLVGLLIGYGLDRLLHTRPFLLILFVVLGGIAGMVNVWRIVAPAPNPGRKS